MQVAVIPALNDNYNFVFSSNGETAVVDPSEFNPIDSYLVKNNLQLDFILNTHHHPDHVGGNKLLSEKYDCQVICSDYDKSRIPCVTQTVTDGDSIQVGDASFQIISVPGHTLGHIVYYSSEHDVLFCGDTLFSLGCGYLFEGNPEQMFNSLNKLKLLPDSTKVYCAHEYTLDNAAFARNVDPTNNFLLEYTEQCKKVRSQGKYTIPSLMRIEKKCNPFLLATNCEHFAKLREQKNNL